MNMCDYSLVKDIKISSIEGMFDRDVIEMLNKYHIYTLEHLFVGFEEKNFLEKFSTSLRKQKMINSIICLLKYKYLKIDLNLNISFDSENLEDSQWLFKELGVWPRSYNVLMRNKITPKKFYEIITSPIAKYKLSRLKNCGDIFANEIYEKSMILLDYYNNKDINSYNDTAYENNLSCEDFNKYKEFSNILLGDIKEIFGKEIYDIFYKAGIYTLSDLFKFTDSPSYLEKISITCDRRKEVYLTICLLRYKYLKEDLNLNVSFDNNNFEDSFRLFSKIGYSTRSLNILLRNGFTVSKLFQLMSLENPKKQLLRIRGCGDAFAEEIYQKTKIVMEYFNDKVSECENNDAIEYDSFMSKINKLQSYGYSLDDITKLLINKSNNSVVRKRNNRVV